MSPQEQVFSRHSAENGSGARCSLCLSPAWAPLPILPLPNLSTCRLRIRSSTLPCSIAQGRTATPTSPTRTVQLEELLHIWPHKQVFKNLIQVFSVVPGPGLGDHSRHEAAKFLQIMTRDSLQDTDPRLKENELKRENLEDFTDLFFNDIS